MERMPTPTYRAARARRDPTLAEALPELTRGDLRARNIRALSDLSRPDAAALAASWPAIPVSTRAALVRRMRALADERIELDFSRALRLGLADPDSDVRVAAIAALWEESGKEIAEQLLDILRNDPEASVRAAAAAGLRQFAMAAERGELDDELSELLREALLTTASDPASAQDVRLHALEAVAVFERDATIWHLIEDAYESTDPDDRPHAIRAMGHNQDPRWTKLVLDELQSRDRALQVAAIDASGELGEEAAIPVLNVLAGDEDPDVKSAAIHALGQIGGRGAVRVLREHLQQAEDDEAERLSEAIDEAVGSLDPLSRTDQW